MPLRRQFVDETVYELAVQRVEHALDLFDEAVVSFSGGKDSTAVLHVTLEAAERRGRLPLRVVFYDEEAIPWETVEYVERVAQDERIALEWYALPLQCRNACSRDDPYWYPWAPEDEEKWVRPMHPLAISSHPTLDGLAREERPQWMDWAPRALPRTASCGMFLGIRADESLSRQRSVTFREHDNYINPWGPGVYRVVPIYDWKVGDVWTAPATLGWDYNRAYDLLEMLGIPPASQRCAPPYGEEPMQGLWIFKEAFPDLWEGMCERVPGASTAARYSKTELYGFGKMVKPDGQPWIAYVNQLLDLHPPHIRAKTSASVRACIDLHLDKSGGAVLLPSAPHPTTGFTWRKIASIAMRGDLKGRRKQMTSGWDPVKYPEKHAAAKARYDAEFAAEVAAGRLRECLM